MPGGRPLKLTPDIQARLCQAIAAGNTRQAAAGYAGLGQRTLYRWLSRGRRATRGQFRQLWHALKKAEADCEVRNVAIIQRAAEEQWQASAWWLERRRPQAWGRIDRMELTGRRGGPIESKHEHSLSPDTAACVLAILSEVGGIPAGAGETPQPQANGVPSLHPLP